MSNIKCQMSIRLNFCRSVLPEFLRSFLEIAIISFTRIWPQYGWPCWILIIRWKVLINQISWDWWVEAHQTPKSRDWFEREPLKISPFARIPQSWKPGAQKLFEISLVFFSFLKITCISGYLKTRVHSNKWQLWKHTFFGDQNPSFGD